MPRKSDTENVRKRCVCWKARARDRRWRTCEHPWYLDYQREKDRFRDNLDVLIGRHCADFREAVDEARRAIVAKLEGRDPKGLVPSDDPTLGQLLDEYDREKPRLDRWQIGRIKTAAIEAVSIKRFGDVRASTVTADMLKAYKRTRPLVAGNRDLALLRAMFNWAIAGGLVERSPFRVGDVPVVRLTREEARSRRLQGDEGERLLAHAGGLADLITAALETGCRKGELLSLQWSQVRFSPRAELFLPAGKTKAKRDRRVPVSSVLAGILTRRRRDPAGQTIPPDGYVFGDEIGRRRHSIKTAWKLTLKRATITDLHFHDLRREAGSRWMDAGIPLATIQRWLGHANIAQTSTYLGASLGGDEQDMRMFEERMGRLDQSENRIGVGSGLPVTHSDVFGPLNHDQPGQSGGEGCKNLQQTAIEGDPVTVIH
jgi:integrase